MPARRNRIDAVAIATLTGLDELADDELSPPATYPRPSTGAVFAAPDALGPTMVGAAQGTHRRSRRRGRLRRRVLAGDVIAVIDA